MLGVEYKLIFPNLPFFFPPVSEKENVDNKAPLMLGQLKIIAR